MKKDSNIEPFEDELEYSSTLSQLEGVNSFGLPVGYFNDLEKNILDKVEKEKSKNKIRLITRKSIYYAAAASLIFIIGLMAFNFYHNNSKNNIVDKGAVKEQTHSISDKNDVVDKSNASKTNYNNEREIDSNIQIVNSKEKLFDTQHNINPDMKSDKEEESNSIQNMDNEDIVDNSIDYNSLESNIHNDANSPSIASGTLQISNQPSKANNTEKSMARRGLTNTQGNWFLPHDTCVNKSFVYDDKLLKKDFPDWNFQWEGYKPGNECQMLESKAYFLHILKDDSLLHIDTINVRIQKRPSPKIIADNEVCSNSSLIINAGINNSEYNYYWSVSPINSPEILLDNLKPGKKLIKLKVTSCIDTVEASFVLNVNNCNIEIPNVFTPNGDGFNDVFEIKGLEQFPGSSLTILDRNGKLVYQSADYKNNWKASNLPKGTYFYSLIINDGNKSERGGMVSIIK
jgi:gliding motility-associated-like protein